MRELPTGTLTLLFTDIEGSTRLLDALGDRYPDVLAQHRDLLRAAVQAHGGVEVDTQGDAFFMVFPRATQAVAAAVAAQRALAAQPWPANGVVRVRMGLHTGEPQRTAEGYAGLDLHRAARIAHAAHGGQVLLSAATAVHVRHVLLDGVQLRDLGAQRLKDFTNPEPLFQLDVWGLPVAFPPLRVLASSTGNLPTQLTSFLGRERELADLTALLRTARLVTLTGPGGSGKTRLAMAAAQQQAEALPDGVWFVDLSGVFDPAGVVPTIAQVLGVTETEGRSLAASLVASLRPKHLLLVLDNFEQVLDAAQALYPLLVEAPALALLVTSRVPLHIAGEQEYAVSPLPLPAAATAIVDLAANPAVALFGQRARAAQADFALTAETAPVVAEVCRRLDGLPLAIELAAARVKLLPPAALLARLEHRLPLLIGGARTLPHRQQTLRNTIQWSWDLLQEPEQVLFRRLGVFAGSFTLEAAEAVCNPDGELDVLAGLATLMDHSFVQQREADSAPRLHVLATLREFALEHLAAAEDEPEQRRRHAAYYADLAERADAAFWHSGRMRADLLGPLDPERDNLVAALQWSVDHQEAAVGLRLAGRLGSWFYARSPGEGRWWTERLLQLPGADDPTAARGRALLGAAFCATAQFDWSAAAAWYEAAAACFRASAELAWLSRALVILSVIVRGVDDARARALADEAVTLAHAVGGPYTIAYVERNVVPRHDLAGDIDAARAQLEAVLRRLRGLDADWLTLGTVTELSRLARRQGRYAEARRVWNEGVPLLEGVGRHSAVLAYVEQGLLAAAEGDTDEAAAQWRQALVVGREVGSTVVQVVCLAGIADVLIRRDQPAVAGHVLGAIAALWPAAEPYIAQYTFERLYEQALAATQAAVKPEAFAQAWAAGQALSLDQAADLALAELATTPTPPTPASPVGA
jgi:predicted ATPase/class 3 adenylate cyclase